MSKFIITQGKLTLQEHEAFIFKTIKLKLYNERKSNSVVQTLSYKT